MMMTTIMTPTIASIIVITSVVWSPFLEGAAVAFDWSKTLMRNFLSVPSDKNVEFGTFECVFCLYAPTWKAIGASTILRSAALK